MQRIRELRRIEYLKEGRNRHHSQNTNDDDKEELTTLLPNLADIKAIEITDNLPVSAFGSNLHIKKKIELLVHIVLFSFTKTYPVILLCIIEIFCFVGTNFIIVNGVTTGLKCHRSNKIYEDFVRRAVISFMTNFNSIESFMMCILITIRFFHSKDF